MENPVLRSHQAFSSIKFTIFFFRSWVPVVSQPGAKRLKTSVLRGATGRYQMPRLHKGAMSPWGLLGWELTHRSEKFHVGLKVWTNFLAHSLWKPTQNSQIPELKNVSIPVLKIPPIPGLVPKSRLGTPLIPTLKISILKNSTSQETLYKPVSCSVPWRLSP